STWKPNVETHQGAGCLSYREGGKGADIRHIKPADNRGAGSYIGNKVEKLPNGAKVKIVVK
ncbi:sporulation protein, partial [Bacillus cereus]|nr:sporulation protein [Bacillus cereus]